MAIPRRVVTRVESDDDVCRYLELAPHVGRPPDDMRFNLHRVQLPCGIPWRILLRVIVMSWPTSLTRLVPAAAGYDYRLAGRWPVLQFRKIRQVRGELLEYEVTGGFARGGRQCFVATHDGELHHLWVDTRVPRGRIFPVRFHDTYLAAHLHNVRNSLFGFQVKHGETLL